MRAYLVEPAVNQEESCGSANIGEPQPIKKVVQKSVFRDMSRGTTLLYPQSTILLENKYNRDTYKILTVNVL